MWEKQYEVRFWQMTTGQKSVGGKLSIAVCFVFFFTEYCMQHITQFSINKQYFLLQKYLKCKQSYNRKHSLLTVRFLSETRGIWSPLVLFSLTEKPCLNFLGNSNGFIKVRSLSSTSAFFHLGSFWA